MLNVAYRKYFFGNLHDLKIRTCFAEKVGLKTGEREKAKGNTFDSSAISAE